jgi:sugar-specific transcriptional regulator TrmB
VSKEKVLKTLEELGLSKLDARVYFFLANKGPTKAKEVTLALKIAKQQLYPSIKSLQRKGLVNASLERPARFSAVSFEKALDLFAKAKMEEAISIQQSKGSLLSDWQSILIEEAEDKSAKFTVIEGRKYIYSKIQQMIQETKSRFSFVSTVPGLARADQYGLFDAAFNHPLKSKMRFRFLTEISDQNVNAVKMLLKRISRCGLNLEGKTPDLGLKLCSRMVIKDEEETLFFIDHREGGFATEQDNVCLWTDCKSLVRAFLAMFDDLWRYSTDIEKRIVEVETGRQIGTTRIINDCETAQKEYQETLRLAEKEVILMTSTEGLIKSWKNKGLLKEWVERGVSVKIMAPITSKSVKAVQKLPKCCEVRHVAATYLETTLVDGKHFFQFETPSPDNKKPKSKPYFGNILHTNNPEYVEKTKRMLNDLWRNAFAPSAITLGSILKPSIPVVAPLSDNLFAFSRPENPYEKMSHGVVEKPAIMTEKEILNKIINAKKYPGKDWPKNIVRYYGSDGTAVIHPPRSFNLPDMMIWAFHYNKQSSFGAEDRLRVYLWLETPQGYAYVPVVQVTDNPRAVKFWKTAMAGTPAGQNVQLIEKNKFQVRVHGNVVFAGWTVPIPLLPSQYILPPSCILFEGYSKIITSAISFVLPSGVKLHAAGTGLNAFVTFFHPSSKYSGPGTDGTIGRDVISTWYPPKWRKTVNTDLPSIVSA